MKWCPEIKIKEAIYILLGCPDQWRIIFPKNFQYALAYVERTPWYQTDRSVITTCSQNVRCAGVWH